MSAVLKSRYLLYVGEWAEDPAMVPAAGLYFRDTRHLLPLATRIDGTQVRLLPQAGGDSTRISLRSEEGSCPDLTVVMELDHRLSWELTAANPTAATFEAGLTVEAQADFRDMFEMRGWVALGRGELLSADPNPSGGILRYQAPDGPRLETTVAADDGTEVTTDGTAVVLRRRLRLGPGETATIRVAFAPGGWWGDVPAVMPEAVRTTRVTTDHPEFDRLFDRSFEDLAALTTWFPDGILPAAGVPWYVAPFGRDSLIAGWQTLHIDPEAVVTTLRTLANLQGRREDPETEEEPGRIIHEARYGELARRGEIPHRPYFGSADATPLFLLVAAEAMAWTGDPELYAELKPALDLALAWVDGWGDRDGDGLVEYHLEPDRTLVLPLTARHQGWKDSDDSLHHRDGSEPVGDIALVEVQGYLHAAVTRLADVAGWMGDREWAEGLRLRAETLGDLVDRLFWMDDEGCYAAALDGDKRQVGTVSSNAGHLLFSGLVPPHRAAALVQRLTRPDMDSGWGIRTLSALAATYDPHSYHNGSVWPHDNWVIADGCYRTGHPGVGDHIFEAIFRLALASPDGTLAELHGGEAGGEAPMGLIGACRPQAWAAGTIPGLVRSALGLRPDPAAGVLVVAPVLPPFLGTVTIEGMTALGHTGTLHVRRSGDLITAEADGLPVRVEAPPSP